MGVKKIVVPLCILLAGIGVCYHFRYEFIDFYKRFSSESEQEEEIDFDYWQARNPDVYAWVRVPGTDIDYPILQNEEDGYYLTHDIDRESNIYGAIYTEGMNSKDFTDPNTVVYGHNMIDDSMFGSLGDFNEDEYFNSHDGILIFTPGEKRTYEIVAAYEYPAEHILTSFNFGTPEGAAGYFQQISGFVQNTGGNIRSHTEIKAPLLTLSTCTSDSSAMRFLVQGVLIRTEKIK